MNKRTIFGISIITLLVLFTISCGEDKKDEPDLPIDQNLVTDIDGNVYHTITIGTQTWMVENLKTTKYNDGTAIANITDNTEWSTASAGAWCNYGNLVSNGVTYGKLYNYSAVSSGKLAPSGWHVPNTSDWVTLYDYLCANPGASLSVAKAMAAKTLWTPSTYSANSLGNNLTINNSSGFTALPGGYRESNGTFTCITMIGTWWSSTNSYSSTAYVTEMRNCWDDVLTPNFIIASKLYGLSVRCVKN